MTMSNLHPGFILIAVGLIALFVPKSLRRPVLAAGPLLGLGAVLTLAPGTNATLPFINGITLHYLHVDALSWIFALIFCMMAAIGGIYACHNSNRMEAFCSMTYAGSALGVTLAQDWLTLIFFSELMAATSLFLIWCKKTPASRQAGYRYLLVHMFGQQHIDPIFHGIAAAQHHMNLFDGTFVGQLPAFLHHGIGLAGRKARERRRAVTRCFR